MAMLARDVWGLTDPQVQQLTAIGSLMAFGGVWLGSRADRWDSRRMWVLTGIGAGITLAGWGLSPNALVGTVFVMANMLFTEALFIVSETFLAHHTTRQTRSFLFGLSGTLGGLTEAAGPALGTSLISLGRLPAPFLAGALVTLLSVVTILPVNKTARQETAAAQATE